MKKNQKGKERQDESLLGFLRRRRERDDAAGAC